LTSYHDAPPWAEIGPTLGYEGTDHAYRTAHPTAHPTANPITRGLAVALAILSAIGLLASVLLAIDGWRALSQPNADLMCAWDAAIDCAPAMSLWQAQLLGFPNAYLGIATWSIALTANMALLAGVTARWFRLGLLIGSAAGQALVFFLMFTTFSQLPALCPWCTVIWVVMWPLLWLQIVTFRPRLLPLRWPVLAGGYLVAAIIGLLTMGLRVF